MNKTTPALLLLLFFVAAFSQHLLVTIDFEEEQATIQTYEWTDMADATRQAGEYTLQLRTEQNNILSQTRFSPYMILGTGEKYYVEELTVPIQAPAGVRIIEVLDENEIIVATQTIASYCGDGLCEEHERASCPLDCAQEAVQEITTLNEEPLVTVSERGVTHYALITAAALLILILVGVLIHLNKNKPREEEETTNQYSY